MLVLIFVTGISLLAVIRYHWALRSGYGYVARAAAPITSRLPTPPRYRELLQKYFSYYKNLSAADKLKFEKKVCEFRFSKRFIPRGMKEVPDDMALFISAVAVQLTFGLPQVYLRHFSKILIYPDNYYSTITKRYHKGEVNPAFGIIVLSWHNFMEGFLHVKDALNLGLHEMAHALRLENIIRNEEFAFFDRDLLAGLDEWCQRICHDEQTLAATPFRLYACTNTYEFFSVAVEVFFEQPVRFYEQVPELYAILAKLLNQDPRLESPTNHTF